MTTQDIVNLVQELMAIVNDKFNSNIITPEVRFHRSNNKMKNSKALGLAARNCSYVSFNMDYAESYPEDFHLTVRHEISHIVQFSLFPNAKQAHGPQFRKICVFLGGTGATKSTYATVDTSFDPKRYVMYKCGCRKHTISKIRHSKIVKGTQTYSCRYCRTKIEIVKE
jgi:SprT protein